MPSQLPRRRSVYCCPSGWLPLVLLALALLARGALGAPAPRPAPVPQPALPELVLQTGHPDKIAGLAWRPDGRSLASISGGSLLIWEPATGLTQRSLVSPVGEIHSVAWSPDGKTLAAGLADGSVRLWDPDTGNVRRDLTGHGFPVMALAWSPDGKTLAYSGWSKRIRLADPATGRLLRELEAPHPGENTLAWSPDGKTLASGSANGEIHLWDPAAGTLRREWTAHQGLVASLAWSADHKLLASASWDGTARVWDASTAASRAELRGHQYFVNAVAFEPRGTQVVTGGADGTIRLWRLNGEPVRQFEVSRGQVQALAWSPDGAWLASGAGSGGLRLWNPATGAVHRDLTGYGFAVNAIAWKPDGRALACGGWGGGTRVLDSATGEPMLNPRGHLFTVNAVAWSPDGTRLALGGLGFEAVSKDQLHTWGVGIWDSRSGKTQVEMPAASAVAWVNAVAWSPDGATLAAADMGGGLRLWDPATGRLLRELRGHEGAVNALAWSADGKTLVSAGADKTIRLWDPAAGKLRRELGGHEGGVHCLAFSPDGKTLASGDLLQSIRLWNVETGAAQREMRSPGWWVSTLAWSPDGAELATADLSGLISIWNPVDGQLRRRLAGHTAQVRSLAWSPDGRRLASASWDGTTRLWPRAAGPAVVLLALRGSHGDGWLAVTPEGYYDGSAEGAQRVTWRVGGALVPAARYERRFHRPGAVRRSLAGEKLAQAPLGAGDIPPAAQFISPVSGSNTTDAAAEIELLGADDRAVQDAEISVNGRPLAPENARPLVVGTKGRVSYGNPLPDGSRPILLGAKPLLLGAKPILMGARSLSPRHRVSKSFRFRVPMPPGAETVRVQAVVYDDQGYNSEPVEIVLRRSGAPDVKGTLHALCVGVSRYANSTYNLKYSAKDAEDVAALLARQKGMYREVRVTRLVDAEATGERVRAALGMIQREAGPADTVILFLSGHGVEDAEGRYYFATHEVDPKALGRTTLTLDQLQQLLGGKLRARSVFVFADTCHSGKIPAAPASNNRLQSLKTGVLASSQGGEYSYEREEWGHGAFTLALLEALEGKADPNAPVVTFAAVMFHVSRRVGELVQQGQRVTVSANGLPLDTVLAGR